MAVNSRSRSAGSYAELHCHSTFSFLDGASSPEALALEAERLGLEALAITDHGVCERAAGALMPGDALLESAPQVADDQDVVNQVLTAPGSLGLVRASTVEEGAKVRLLRIDGTLPTTKEFAFGRYRASSPLVVATRGPAQGAALQYIEAARKAPAARGFSPLQ